MNNNDLRVIKTKRNIENAVIELLNRMDFNDIQVMDICKEAECSRNTFYSHYYNKYELINSMIEYYTDKICETFSGENFKQDYVNEHGYGTEIIIVSQKYQKEISVFLNSGYSGEFKEMLRKKLYNKEIEYYKNSHDNKTPDTEISLCYHFQIGGVVEFVCSLICDYPGIDRESAAATHAKINTPVAKTIIEMCS